MPAPNLRTGASTGTPIPTVDYYPIVARTVAKLKDNSVEARHSVYECARQVVYRRLQTMRPPPSKHLIELEQLSLDLAIKRVETETIKATPPEPPRTEPAPPPPAPTPPSEPPPARRMAHVRNVRAQTVRLLGMAGVIAGICAGYWLLVGKPDISSAFTAAGLATSPQSAAVRPPAPTAQAAANADDGEQAGATRPAFALANGTSGCGDASTPSERVNCTDIAIGGGGAMSATPSPGRELPFWISAYHNIAAAAGPSRTSPRQDSGAASPAAPATSGVRGLYERALASMNRGDFDRALHEFADVIRADPLLPDTYVSRGQLFFKNGNADRAIDDFNDALRLDRGNAVAFKSRGMVYLYRGDEDGAIADLTKAIQLVEASSERMTAIDLFYTRRSRAALYDKKQQFDRELIDLNAMIDAYWKNPALAEALRANYQDVGAAGLMATIYRLRAAVYAKRTNYEGAIADLSFALQLDAQRGFPALIERARIQETLGRRDGAIADFQKALELNPQNDEAKSALTRLRGQAS